ncbi:Gfo/Idh/MocA family protein [Niabella drilacis]|uniref:Predicted dehydrogenase n=1 Tax=Niabella drilacis (strain DSM 25811 / CCM 8410 / CCUG 62505 / LMG 26954 / E90) TaxID=1285928 RepID=A0A1G6WCC8_NIADE|nr:Gfo/Idh/MocA family oxidoreductase [Niabella drilacis]SDD63478.1 Predicted dehydrogenase [Niabella drilacis]
MLKKKTMDRKRFLHLSALAGIGLGISGHASAGTAERAWQGKRIGIIGLDTSHAVAFTKSLNGNNPDPAFMGYRVVAAYPNGSKDIPSSVERIPGYTADVHQYGVTITGSIAELLPKVDAVCLETNDGRLHLEQALPVLKAGKPLFIDKPMTASLKDAVAIFKAAEQYKVPVFSSSSLRYITGMEEILKGEYGKVTGAQTYSPATLEKTHPDLFWYGIHGVEILFTAMGPGCRSVVRVHTPDTDVVTGTWGDGRVGNFRGTRSGKADYGGTVFTEKKIVSLGGFKGYDPLLKEIIRFFETGKSPVATQDTLDILAFMEAADESRRRNGVPVTLESVYKKANYKTNNV